MALDQVVHFSGRVNALTFDVEAWFHAHNLDVASDRWEELPTRLDRPIREILSLLRQYDTRATFFVLGWIAQRQPDLVRLIHRAGHEIASHGYWHRPVTTQSPSAFRDDVRAANEVLEPIVRKRIAGYRAPGYSIGCETRWALEELQALGFTYDSSIYPVRSPHRRYGMPHTPLVPYRVCDKLWEFPLPTWQVLGGRLPVATGGYLRIWPLVFTHRAIRQNLVRSIPVVVNIHPWELDPDQPRLRLPWVRKRLHYQNLHTTRAKLESLLRRYRFAPLADLLAQHQPQTRSRRRSEVVCPAFSLDPSPLHRS